MMRLWWAALLCLVLGPGTAVAQRTALVEAGETVTAPVVRYIDHIHSNAEDVPYRPLVRIALSIDDRVEARNSAGDPLLVGRVGAAEAIILTSRTTALAVTIDHLPANAKLNYPKAQLEGQVEAHVDFERLVERIRDLASEGLSFRNDARVLDLIERISAHVDLAKDFPTVKETGEPPGACEAYLLWDNPPPC